MVIASIVTYSPDAVSALPSHRTAVLRLFFLSGLAGILFEVFWTRLFTFVLGSGTQSVAAVVTAFMLGLGLGSWLFGRVSPRIRNALRAYGLIELGVAASGLAAIHLFPAIEGMYGSLYAHWDYATTRWLAFGIAFAFITVPATLLGGSLPLLVRHFVGSDEKLGSAVGELYALNTLGAAAGAILALALVFTVGYSAGYHAGIALDALIGLAALFFSRSAEVQAPPVRPQPSPGPHGGLLLLAFGLSGFSALVYEVVWFRTLDFLLLGKLTTFACVLAIYLLGNSLGSLTLGRRLGPPADAIGLFTQLQWLLAILGLVSLPLLAWITRLGSRPVGIGVFLALVFASTFLLGAVFPTAARLHRGPVALFGRAVGNLYSANTVGAVAGSFLAGFVLIPSIGTRATWLLAAGVNLAIALGMGAFLRKPAPSPWPSPASGRGYVVAAALAVVLALSGDWLTRYEEHTVIRPGFRILEHRESALEDTSVAEDAAGERVLMGGPFQSGETTLTRRQTQRLQSHLPMLLAREPRDALEIGYGVGELARNIQLYHPRTLQLAEIDENMIPLADRYFAALNDRASQRPNVRVALMDGRHFLHMTPQTFDVIMSDSMILASEGSLRLYSLEHFQEGRRHLNPGGVMLVWLPINVGVAKSLVIIRTFLEAFPQTLLWLPFGENDQEGFLVGFRDEAKIDLDRWQERFQSIAASELALFGWDSPGLFFGSFRAGPERLADLTKGVTRLNRDVSPVLDFLPTESPAEVARLVRILSEADNAFIFDHLRAGESSQGLLDRLREELPRVHAADLRFLDGVDQVGGNPAVPFRQALQIYPGHRGACAWLAVVSNGFPATQAALEEAVQCQPFDVMANQRLAELALARGDLAAARSYVEHIRAGNPYFRPPPPLAALH
jgi:spermidine synthase